jgi:hypothetical protein
LVRAPPLIKNIGKVGLQKLPAKSNDMYQRMAHDIWFGDFVLLENYWKKQ